MLAEFVYGLKPKETFAELFGIDQIKPRKAFYHLKKASLLYRHQQQKMTPLQDFFPWVYYNRMVKGEWFGPKGVSAPSY